MGDRKRRIIYEVLFRDLEMRAQGFHSNGHLSSKEAVGAERCEGAGRGLFGCQHRLLPLGVLLTGDPCSVCHTTSWLWVLAQPLQTALCG